MPTPSRLTSGIAALLLATALPRAAAEPAYTNRLAASSDPYLLEHAHNPVDWYPWGPEAFAKAKAEGKPIFLSIGYSTCYWCHVAERTIYSNPEIAAVMNKWFVNVKVDREQRPDVDRLYIAATEILTQHGAWPNNLFLTPDLEPFYAGSYFPPRDDGETPGFPKVLAAIHDLWENHRADKVRPAADDVMKALRGIAAKAAAAVPVTPDAWLAQGAQALLRSVDPVNGGLGSPTGGPKFPQVPALDLILAAARRDGGAPARAKLEDTLAAMAEGGIRDQLAGGFYRYATEPTWSVPHFEKMLSDNAQLLSLYADTYAVTGSPLDRLVALDTAHWMMRDMALPDGGFATATDAATDGIEGAAYTWTRPQVEAVLDAAETEKFLGAYDLVPMPEVRTQDPDAPLKGAPPAVLRLHRPIAQALQRVGAPGVPALIEAFAPAREKLLAARGARPQPMRDDKVVAGLNGLAIGGLAAAGKTLDAPDLTAAATKAAERLWSLAWDEEAGDLKHQIYHGTAAGDGYVEDYAMLGGGLLSLADASGESHWRERAVLLADAMLKRFLQADGSLSSPAAANALPIALGDNADTDVPSGTSAALDLLGRLAALPDGARFVAAQARIAADLSGRIAAHPTMWPSAVAALAAHPPSAAALVAAAPPAPTKVAEAPPADVVPAGVPSTADHVHATARLAPGGGVLTVELHIDPGFHINAHKPSLDYLVPTALDLAGLPQARIDYPPALRFTPSFAKAGLDVYEGDVRLVATLPNATATVTGTLTAQACDARTCLPPATLPIGAQTGGAAAER